MTDRQRRTITAASEIRRACELSLLESQRRRGARDARRKLALIDLGIAVLCAVLLAVLILASTGAL